MEIKNTKRKREREVLLIALVVVLVRPLTVTPILLQPSHCPLPPLAPARRSAWETSDSLK